MFSMIKCDLACLRGVARNLAGTALFVAAIFALAMGASGVLCAATIVIALSVVNRLMAYDEQNNWQAFRQALPLSRGQVVCGRYVTVALCVLASLLVGIAVALLTDLVISVVVSMHPGLQLNNWSELLDLSLRPWDLLGLFAACGAAGVAVSFFGLALTLPFMFRFGFTKGARYIPLVFVVLSLLVVLGMEGISSSGFDPASLAPLLENTGTIVGISLGWFSSLWSFTVCPAWSPFVCIQHASCRGFPLLEMTNN